MSRIIDIIYKGSAAITENTENHVTLTVSDGGNKSGDVNADEEFIPIPKMLVDKDDEQK